VRENWYATALNGPVAQLGARFHGMEEVVGSIPTRSTKSLNKLDRASACDHDVCVVVCVITRRFGTYGKASKPFPTLAVLQRS
jgi:hypothetical protein